MPTDKTRSQFERRLTRLATTFATVATVSFWLLGVVFARPDIGDRAVVAAMIAIVGILGRLVDRERAVYVIGAAAVGTMVFGAMHPSSGQATTAVALTICLMALGFFVRRKRIIAVMGVVVLGYLLGLSSMSGETFRLADALTTGLAMYFGIFMVLALRRDMVAGSSRHAHLFREAPVALWEEDFSQVAAALDDMRVAGISNVRDHLEDRSELVRLVDLIKVRQVNEAAIAMLDADVPADLLVPLVVTDDNAPAFIDQMVAMWDGSSSVVSEILDVLTLRGRPFSILLHWSVPHVEGVPDYRRVQVATVDLTIQKDHERRLRELLDARDEFVATISHELRTPLTAVVGLSEELRDRSDEIPEPERIELTALIAAQSLEVANIVEDLLVASRVGSDQVAVRSAPVDMVAEVRSVLDGYLGPGREVVVADTMRPVRLALGDEARVRQILRNLVVNTQRYGGPAVRAVIEERDGRIVTEIRDDGSPLPTHQRNAIFQPFFRARQTHGVTASVGLGLTVSRELARLMGGELSYEHDGSEAIFSLKLPVLADEDAPAREALVY